MKKVYTIISIFILLFTAFDAGAQDATKQKSYISLYSGWSIPQGNYAGTDYNNNQAGFAKRGVTIAVDGAVYLKKNFAIAGIISFQDQGKLNQSNTDILSQGYVNSYSADNAKVIAYDRYHNWNILIGPQYSFTYKDFILDLRASAGLVWVTSTPETSIALGNVPEQTATFYQRRSAGKLFGYGASGGLRYKLGDTWTVGIKESYVASGGTTVTNEGRTENLGRLVTKLPISELQTTLGFSLSF
jgi:hypothetical protein